MIRFSKPLIVVLGFLLASTGHADAAGDVAFITQLSGSVTVEGKEIGKELRSAVPFSKLQVGEKVTLPKDARLRLVFFDGGRQETWSGSAVLTLDSQQSRLVSGNAPEVSQVSPIIAKQLMNAPSAVGVNRTGAFKTRKLVLKDPLAVAKIEERYEALLRDSSKGDVLPTLYKLSALYAASEKMAVSEFISELKQDKPGSSDVAAMVSQYELWAATPDDEADATKDKTQSQ